MLSRASAIWTREYFIQTTNALNYQERIADLMKRVLAGEAGTEDYGELHDLLRTAGGESYAADIEHILSAEKMEPGALAPYDPVHWDRVLNAVLARDKGMIVMHGAARKRTRYRWWAAAAVLLLIAAGAYLWRQQAPVTEIAKTEANDILPGANKAVLTLSDGSTLALDSSGNRVIRQGATAAHQQGGLLTYVPGTESRELRYNMLSTPRGGQFRLQLPDGTMVWLNAASSIRYPTVFAGNERSVEVTGEVYFDVAPNMKQPFRVHVNHRVEIEALGTQFNVNAYEDEKSLNTTLLEGLIRVSANSQAVLLKPGQQAQLTDRLKVVHDVSPDQVIAWKNGLFNLEDATLDEVMRQLSRWYDITVIYEKGIPDIAFSGRISRNMQLPNLIRTLEKLGVHLRVEAGRKLIVMP